MVTIVAFSLGLEQRAQGLGIVALLFIASAFLRTVIILNKLQFAGLKLIRTRDKMRFFVRSLGIFFVTYLAAATTSYAAFWMGAFGVSDGGGGGAIDIDPEALFFNILLIVGGCFFGLASGGSVLVLLGVRWWPVGNCIEVSLVEHDFGRAAGETVRPTSESGHARGRRARTEQLH
jgi:hypothetical protein